MAAVSLLIPSKLCLLSLFHKPTNLEISLHRHHLRPCLELHRPPARRLRIPRCSRQRLRILVRLTTLLQEVQPLTRLKQLVQQLPVPFLTLRQLNSHKGPPVHSPCSVNSQPRRHRLKPRAWVRLPSLQVSLHRPLKPRNRHSALDSLKRQTHPQAYRHPLLQQRIHRSQ